MVVTNTVSKYQRKPLIHKPHDHDVLTGRKVMAKKHPGNQLLIQIAEQKKDEYKNAFFRKQKKLVAQDIIQEIKNLSPPGRFLALEDKSSSAWREVDHDTSTRAVCLTLRELAKIKSNTNIAQADQYHRDISQNGFTFRSQSNAAIQSRQHVGVSDDNNDSQDIEEKNVDGKLEHGDSLKPSYEQVKNFENSISILGQSLVEKPIFCPRSKRILGKIANVGKVQSGATRLPSIVGSLLERIEELEKESRLAKESLPI